MADEIKLEGLGVAPGVLETIVSLAAEEVEGVASVGPGGIAGAIKKGQGVDVALTADGAMEAVVHIHVTYGQPLREVAARVQHSVAEALQSQVGHPVACVDVFVDGVVFGE